MPVTYNTEMRGLLRDLRTPGDRTRRGARLLAPFATASIFLVVLLAGGAPTPYLQLPYIAIILGAYGGGTRVGLAYGIACAILFDGPHLGRP